jgi:DNA-binding transcriptional LysR family regulator
MADREVEFTWDDIRLVKAIADACGLIGAAEILGINHSTVFRRLGQIEAAMKTTLFERHRNGYAATPAGEEMAALGARMENDVAAFALKLAGSQPAPHGELRVTTNDSLLVHLLTPLFAKFQTHYPDIRLDVVLGNQVLNLSKRDADIAIRATDNPPDTLVGRQIARVAWALYGRASDYQDAPEGVPTDLFDRRWVALADNLGHLQAAKHVRLNVAPENIVYKLNTVLGLADAIEQGIGIGHLPCLIGDNRAGLVRLSVPVDSFSAGLWLLTHPDLRHAPRVRAFMEFMGQELSRGRAIIEGQSR